MAGGVVNIDEEIILPDVPERRQKKIIQLTPCFRQGRICPIWVNSPELWFLKLENEMRINNVNSDQYYHLLVRHLDEETMAMVAHIIRSPNPPDYNKYSEMKETIIHHCKIKRERKVHQALNNVRLDGKLPSVLYKEMDEEIKKQYDFGDTVNINSKTLKRMWLKHLPPAVSNILKGMIDDTTDNLVESADLMMRGCLLPNESHCEEMESALCTLGTDTQRLTYKIEELITRLAPNGHSVHDNTMNRIPCFYHRQFGKRATNYYVIGPCSKLHFTPDELE